MFLKVKSRGIPSSVSCRLYTGPFELNLWGLTDNTVKRTRCCSICRRRATSQRVADIIQLSTLSEMRIYFYHVFQISKKAMHFLKHFIRFNFIYIMCRVLEQISFLLTLLICQKFFLLNKKRIVSLIYYLHISQRLLI